MYFTFDQNNSGGSYERNEDVLEYVIIEAVTALEANCKAEEIGIYFDGCSSGLDCKWLEQDLNLCTFNRLKISDSCI